MPMPAEAQGNAQSATYRVTFEGKFTASALASGVSVPSGAHFTTLIGAVHNGNATFWSSGGTASVGIGAVAELGATDTFKSEIAAAMLNALAIIEQSIASGPAATATLDITLTTDHPLVTLLSMIGPSPDWFVGVSGLSLLDAQNEWLSQHQVDLFPYDAGTEEGTEFSLSNPATSPQGTITSIKGTGKFSDEPIATLTFDHQSVNTAPELILAASPAEIVEAGGSAMVTVEITNGVTFAEDQGIALSFAGTATQGTDYTVVLESLTLTAGESSVATTVTAVQDRVDDDAETILITASHGGGTIGAEQTITIIDDDTAPAVTTCSGGMAGTYPCSNVDLMSFLASADIGGGSANDIWGWTDSSTGKEYAIMGRSNGTSFVDISDPVNPIYLGNLPPHSASSGWRDIKVYADHAFIVTEANNSGMQVFDLTQLRAVASPPATFSGTAHYSGFSTAHNLAINEDSGFAYAVGTNDCGGGLHMIDIQTPTSPTAVGCFSADGDTHDAQCVNYAGPDLDHQGTEICFNSNEDTLTIVDVTNKAAPVMLSRTGYSGSRYTHQGWLTEDQAYFLLDDEEDERDNPNVTNTRTYMWDVSDLDAPAVIGFHDSTTTATDHNQYVKGGYTYQSNYQAGLRILDITDIANGNLSEAAFFDVYPGGDSTSFIGTWSNYPFFDSGIVIVSVIGQGLFILRPNLVDSVNPALAAAAVNGAALTLTYREVLDGSSTPATDAFTVTVVGSGRMVTHVSVSGRVVTLTLASAVAHGEAVTVSYSPGTNPIQDAAGNAADGLSNDPVRNDTPDTTPPEVPVITTTSPILVSENETAVATLTASDDDTASDQLTWTIPSGEDGGADAGHFTLSEAGILAYSAAKDYEDPDDADADGTYEVTVQVSDGDNPATADILVTVTDLAPALTGPATTSHAEGRRGMRLAAYRVVDGDDWSLAGNDSALFTIADGFLRFVDPPDYENASDAGNDNVYDVTVRAGDGTTTESIAVAVTVTNAEEAGVATLSPLRPKLDTPLVASLADPDTLSGTPAWQWERANGREGWEAIDGATAASYTPTAADADRYLRATATYTDGLGAGKTAQATAPHVVIAHRLSAFTVPADRAFYPTFDPDTLHYAARCTASVALTLTPEDTDTRLSVNGVQRPKGEAFTVEGLHRESDIRITLTGAKGASTTYTLHCIARVSFPKLTTVKAAGATEDLMMFRAKWRPSGGWRGSLIMMDNNGVPRFRKYVADNVQDYFRVFPDETRPRARYGYMKQGSSFNADGVELVVLDKYFDTVDDDIHILSPFRNTDGHDFSITPNGDYVLMAYSPRQRDLSFLNTEFPDLRNDAGDPLGTNEAVQDSAIQVRTSDGTVEFNWNSWDHMAIEDCISGSTFRGEYGHINSLGSIDGDIIAGFRHCSKILRIDVDTGDVVWRAGPSILSREQWEAGETLQPDRGPAPLDFVNDPRGGFSGQHGGHMTADGNLLVYDNATHCDVPPGVPEDAKALTQCFEGTRAVEYAIDVPNEELVFQREFRMPGTRKGGFAGHADPIDNGDWMISWSNTTRSGPMPNTAMHVDAETDTQKLAMTLENIAGDRGVGAPHHTRVSMVSPVALAARVEPLETTIVSRAAFHTGTADRPTVVVAFNRPVVDFDHTTPSLNVAGATVSSVSPHVVAGAAANAYVVTLTPAGAGDITFGLVAVQPCAGGGICAADGTVLAEVPASHVIRADTTPPTVSRVEISSDPGSDRTYVAEDAIRVTATFSETVEVTGRPQLRLELGEGRRTATYEGGSGTAALVFAYEVADVESDTDGVGVEADSLSGGTIRDVAGHDAVLEHDGLGADSGHKVDAVKPELAATGGAVVNGATLTLTYDEPLDRSSTPAAGDFTVSGGDAARTVSNVAVSGSAVVLTLDAGAEHLEAGILVSYTPGTNPIRDVPGNEAEALSRESVTNETPDTTPPEVSSLTISSNPGSDETYAAGDAIEVTVSFSETVDVEGRPQLRLRVGSRNRMAGYLKGMDTAALVFGYAVADGDEDTDGVSVEAGRITLNGGTIEDEADNTAELAHEARPAQAGHKVDGVRPEFLSAAVEGASLTLAYGEALDPASRPAAGDFTVEVGSSGRSVSGVSVSGGVVTMTLDPAVQHGEAGIQVSYTPGTNPIRDAVGNDARALSNRSVTNTTGAPNTAPAITSPSSFDVRENQSAARRLVARDTDPGDEVTGWAIVGGVDQGQFTIASDTGVLSFRTAPDYESPVDATSTDPVSGSGDNEYVVTLEVRSGTGARQLEAEQTLTVRVTDGREPPGVPEAPTFSGETADSLTLNWSEPDNSGPPITDYDVQYREAGSGGSTDAHHEGPGLSLTLANLEAGTLHEVQVRATNDEGTGDWSAPGEGRTTTPLTVQMTTDLPPPVEGAFTVRFSFSEPVSGFSRNNIETGQDPACADEQNVPVFCEPGMGPLETIDDRIFTASMAPGTDRVAHNYTLSLTVPTGRVTSLTGNKPNEEAMLAVRVAPPGSDPADLDDRVVGDGGSQPSDAAMAPAIGERRITDHPLRIPLSGRRGGVERLGKRPSPGAWSHCGEPHQRPGVRLPGAGGQRSGQGLGGDSGGDTRDHDAQPGRRWWQWGWRRRRRWLQWSEPNGAGRAHESNGGGHRWGGGADVGGARRRRRRPDHGLRVPNRRGGGVDFDRLPRHHAHGHRSGQRYGLRLPGAGGEPHRPEPAFGPGGGDAESGGGSGLYAFHQWSRHHLRPGVRESVHPADPTRPLLLRPGRQSHRPGSGGGRDGRSGGHRRRRSEGPDGDGAAGRTHDSNPRAGGSGEWIGEGSCRRSHRRGSTL